MLMLVAGCSASPRGVAHWESRQGGVCADAALADRLERACAPLRAVHGLERCQLAIIESDEPCAYAWPAIDGRVYVTSGLMALADDGELAAAVAHEMGHLVDDGHVQVASLTGAEAADAERRADVIGRRLLHEAGLPTDALRRLLFKIADATPGKRDALIARAEALPH